MLPLPLLNAAAAPLPASLDSPFELCACVDLAESRPVATSSGWCHDKIGTCSSDGTAIIADKGSGGGCDVDDIVVAAAEVLAVAGPAPPCLAARSAYRC